jgi:hypothetical protein
MANQVGQELLNVPFPDMVKNLALAIAEGQTALDKNSIEVAKALAEERIDLPGFPKPKRIANPDFNAALPVSPTNQPTKENPEKDPADGPPAVNFPLIALGISPTFYQFTSAVISVKMAITMTISTDISVNVKAGAKFKAFSASVNASYSRKYDYKVEGSSSLEVHLAPLPPPKAMQDYVEGLIQALQANNAPLTAAA